MRIDISNRVGTTSNFGGFRGLLDKFSGAAAGYSLRKLSKSATNAVRVRRSSDNTEQDIGFAGTELDTTTLLDFVNARDVAPADYGAGAAAAYSLRYVSDSYTGDVVRVRRSVDNAEADFNPTEITDGTLLSFVNGVNLLTYSNQFDTTWTTQNASVTGGQSGYDGSSDAWLLTSTSTTNARVEQSNTNSGVQTFSVYAKAGTANFIRVMAQVTGSGIVWYSFFDLANGTIETNAFLIDKKIESVGATGWYRCSITYNSTNVKLVINACDADGSTAVTSGNSIYIQDAQLELGSTATTYTETTDAPSGYGYVTTWYDQSGNSNDATQGTAASQPKIVDAGVLVEENGKPAVDFTEANQQRLFTTYVLNSEFSIFTTQKVDKTVVVVLGDERLSSLPANTFCIAILGTGEFGIRTSPTLDTAGAINIATQFQTTFISDGLGGISYYADSLLTDTTTGNQVSFTQNINIGGVSDGYADRTLDGRLSEVIIYDTDQSSNRGNIEANVNDYYSIYTSTNDGFVTTWYDQAGSNDATQATAAAQPQIVDGGSLITENGKVALDFDGVDDCLGSNFSSATNNSIFTVSKTPQSTPSSTIVLYSNYGAAVASYLGINTSDQWNIFRGNSLIQSATLNTKVLTSHIFEDNSDLLYVNGNTVISGDGGNRSFEGISIGCNDIFSGANAFWTEPIQELIIYNSDQSGNRTAIEGNINKNYQMYWDGAGYSLLDNFAGAEAAYALVPLSSTYRGAIVKVRRASDNAERDIYANYDGTLDTASLLDFCSGTDGYVSVWYDQSGNGNDAVQSTASAQPQIVSGGSLITSNGYTVIQYDGSDDNLTTSLTATGTMLMGGSDGSAFYEVAISGSYSLLANASNTDHPLNESIRVIWGSSLTTAQKSAIETAVTYTDWDFSDVTSFENYWRLRSNLTDFPLIEVTNGSSFRFAWFGCSSLTSFPALDLSSGTNFFRAWNLCSSLQDFPANMFDSVTATDFTLAFDNTNLTQTSIDNILTSIDTANTSNGTFDQSGGSAPSATGEAAIDNLRARGWTVTVTGGY